MQEKIVKYILTEMSDSLDSKQQVRLQEVLLTAFEQVVMMPTESEERRRSKLIANY